MWTRQPVQMVQRLSSSWTRLQMVQRLSSSWTQLQMVQRLSSSWTRLQMVQRLSSSWTRLQMVQRLSSSWTQLQMVQRLSSSWTQLQMVQRLSSSWTQLQMVQRLSSSWTRGHVQMVRPLSSSWTRGHVQMVRPLSSSWTRGHVQMVRPLSSSWTRGHVQMVRPLSSSSQVGVFFDVDGVLLRGRSVLPAARRAFRKLLDEKRRFRVPVVLVTNAGSCERHQKAEQLSRLLDVQIAPDQVVLSHSPLETMTSFHNQCVLVSGQGPVARIAQSLGFQKVLTMEQLAEQHPLLDMVDHSRRPRAPSTPPSVSQIQAVLLLGEPVRWETNLQLLVDVLLTNGRPGCKYNAQPPAQLPVLACNTDLLWMAEAPSPRFGHGMFLLCLESLYQKLTSRELRYDALLGKPALLTYQHAERLLRQLNRQRSVRTIYAVGDNLMTDIYGANLYNRYLKRHHAAMATSAKLAVQGTAGDVTEEEEPVVQCHSVLVCTGVYDPSAEQPADWSSVTQMGGQSHRDLVLDPGLLEPRHVVEDVEAAVDLLLQQEAELTSDLK